MPTLANYHTHTMRCNHATGSEQEYIQTALQSGMAVLGFSDHTPWAYADPHHYSRIRMGADELEEYVATLQRLRAQYAGQIKLYIGLEAEYYPAYLGWLLSEQQRLGIDYLILGNHYDLTDESGIYFGSVTTPDGLWKYAERTIAGMEAGCYRYLAHPDLCLNRYRTFDKHAEAVCRLLCETAARLDLPLEYNLPGLTRQVNTDGGLGYTRPEFWQIAAEYPVKAIVGCDAHSPHWLALGPDMLRAKAWLQGLGIQVLHTLPGLD